MRKGGGCMFLVAMLLGAAVLAAGYYAFDWRKKAEARDEMLNGGFPDAPRWVTERRPCRAPDAQELAQDAAMARLATLFDGERGVGLSYVQQYFGTGYMGFSRTSRCPPAPEFYAQIAPVLERADWLAPALEPIELRLVERLPPSPYLARRLAEKALADYPSIVGPMTYDDRPYLRMLLAYQGSHARPWAKRALAEIAPDTRLGTSAAFLAVSVAPKEALPRVSRAMAEFSATAADRQIEDKFDKTRGFTLRDGHRLRELAYALSTAGPAAEPYSAPLIALLDQRFATGSHFGLLLVEPKELCIVADRIGGRAAAAAQAKPYCREAATP